MGLPGFFKWLMMKYKKGTFVFCREKLQEKKELEDFDCLYLDCNCAIHPVCFNVLKEHNNITDNDKLEILMIKEVINYIDMLINYIKPSKLIYIAIDGVATVAKIKQQRLRRFKSIHDKILFDKIKKKHGKEISNFWSNSSITPGTVFMDKLTNEITKYCEKLQSNYKTEFQIIFSSAYTPAEGEHKILQYIRNCQRNNIFYGKSIIYGLDADLIFLALSTQMNHLFLLRESQEMNSNDTGLNIVSIDIMKNCIFETIKKNIFEEFENFDVINLDQNQVIDDFIFICYFLGNDFLPHIPSIDVAGKGLDYLIDAYCSCKIDFEINNLIIRKNNKIVINEIFLEKFIEKLSNQEEIFILEETNKHYKKKCFSSDNYDREMFRIDNLLFKIDDPVMLGINSFQEYRSRYYKHYFYDDSEENIDEISKIYWEGISWVTQYYFDQCPSWSWYYSHNHGPFIKDLQKYLKNNKLNKIKFKIGKPLKPIEQLLCVLPPQSNFLIPNKIKEIMTDDKSDLIHLYPTDFEQDYINKNRYWQCIPYLPYIEIDLIKNKIKKIKDTLSKNDKKLNRKNDKLILNGKL